MAARAAPSSPKSARHAAGELQAAMHSLKDMPGNEETPGLVIARDPASRRCRRPWRLRAGVSIEDFTRRRGQGFKIGTNAVRRAAYVRRLFPQAEVIHYRGAADTRVFKTRPRRQAAASRWRRGRAGRRADDGAFGVAAHRARIPHRLRFFG